MGRQAARKPLKGPFAEQASLIDDVPYPTMNLMMRKQSPMKKIHIFSLIGAAFLFNACIPSLNPFCSDKDLVVDNRLVGKWQEQGEKDNPSVWEFDGADKKIYTLTLTEKKDNKDKKGKFKARLFKLKEHSFLDLIPSECEFAEDQADLVAFSVFPGHLLLRVHLSESELKVAGVDYDWLSKHLEKNPTALAHHQEDDRLILTASTADLQQFVLKHLGEDELFESPETLGKQPVNP